MFHLYSKGKKIQMLFFDTLFLEWPRVKKSRVIVGQTPDGRGMDQYHFACLGTSLLRSLAQILGTIWMGRFFFLKRRANQKNGGQAIETYL